MKTLLNVVGLDPSLRNFGIVNGIIHIPSEVVKPTGMKVLHAKNVEHKFKNISDLTSLPDVINELWDTVSEADIIFCELPHGSQSSRAMYSYGVCVALVALLISQGKPVIVTRQSQREQLLGKDKVTKQDMIDWFNTHYPDNQYFQALKNAEREHAADAMASIVIGLKMPDTQKLIQEMMQ